MEEHDRKEHEGEAHDGGDHEREDHKGEARHGGDHDSERRLQGGARSRECRDYGRVGRWEVARARVRCGDRNSRLTVMALYTRSEVVSRSPFVNCTPGFPSYP